MSNDGHFTRIDVLDIKNEIEKKLGTRKAQKYFSLLDSFFGIKLGKSEFDKLCIGTIGRENLCLHNRLIRSILKNATLSKTPPLKRDSVEKRGGDSKVIANGYQRSCIQSLCRDVFPQSRKGKTGFRDRKGMDRPSPLGPHGKPNAVVVSKGLEQQSPTELLSLGSRPPVDGVSVEDGEEVDQAAISPGIYSRSPVTPPYGVPWNVKVARKVLKSDGETCHRNGYLPDTSSLRRRLEQKLGKDGMRVSTDCVNLLNNGLDTFLKRLIKAPLELSSSRASTMTMLDFRTAMELNPKVLGEDWPVQLEKVCFRECEGGD